MLKMIQRLSTVNNRGETTSKRVRVAETWLKTKPQVRLSTNGKDSISMEKREDQTSHKAAQGWET